MHKIIFLSLIMSFLFSVSASYATPTYKNDKNFICYPKYAKASQKIASDKATKGLASWYGRDFHKKKTSSGERYNMYQLTAAHKTLPLSSYVLVTNLSNKRQVIVRVNDRGPFIRHRIIDLSYAAAKEIGMVNRGIARVKVEPVTCKPFVKI